jgi:hypothetical protein
MRYAPVLSAALVATVALLSLPAQAGERYLVVPEEMGSSESRAAAQCRELSRQILQQQR